MKDVLSKLRRMDWVLSACMVSLIVMGVVFINSAGAVRPTDALRNLWRVHATTALFGLAVYAAFAFLDYRKLLDWAALPAFAASCTLLVIVLFAGTNHFGGRRWLWFFQPSEIAKLAVILYAAHVFAEPGRTDFRGFLAGSRLRLFRFFRGLLRCFLFRSCRRFPEGGETRGGEEEIEVGHGEHTPVISMIEHSHKR